MVAASIDDWAKSLLEQPADRPLVVEPGERARLRELLHRSQRMESLGLLSAGLAHEFANVLTTILANLQLAHEHLDERALIEDDLRELREAVDRGASLAHQMLGLARPQAARKTRLDLCALLRRADRVLRRVLDESIELSVHAPEQAIWVEVDAARMEQVILNLVLNARDAMPKGGRISIELATVVVDDAYAASVPEAPRGACVELSVLDTGQGMTPETLARVFDPLFTTKPVGQGTGLGLATSREYVAQFGGHIWAWSEEGAGSVFRVLVPQASGPCVELGGQVPERAPLPGGRVMVVEDDGMVRDALGLALESQGYSVLCARTPGDALLHLEADPEIAVAVVDVVMPEMSGPELARRLIERRPDLLLLFVSGYAAEAQPQIEVSGRLFELLLKPFAPSVLGRRVAELLLARATPSAGENVDSAAAR